MKVDDGNSFKASKHKKKQTKRRPRPSNNADADNERFPCSKCGKSYLRKRHLQRHSRDECIGIPPRFGCEFCSSRFRRKYHMVRHLTSKHGVPAAEAQKATGKPIRNHNSSGSTMQKDDFSFNHHNRLGNCDNNLPENLTMPKENYESKPPPQQFLNHYAPHHLNNGGGVTSISPTSYITSGDSGSDCNVSRTTGGTSSPLPGIMPISSYGLTGAIKAISAAAAHVEEKDAKMLIEAAAQAAAAVAANNNMYVTTPMQLSPLQANEHIKENQMQIPTTANTTSTSTAASGNNTNEILSLIKNEPMTPNKTATPSAAAAPINMLDEDWKMKLSLQLISNSLLQERLMNSMSFNYNNN